MTCVLRCDPTSYDDLQAMFITDLGQTIDETFESFNPKPIGVASLAQVSSQHRVHDISCFRHNPKVHVAVLNGGQKVAIKARHIHTSLLLQTDKFAAATSSSRGIC